MIIWNIYKVNMASQLITKQQDVTTLDVSKLGIKGEPEYTNSGIVQKPEETLLTQSIGVKTQEVPEDLVISPTFSGSYIAHHTSILVENVISQLAEWQESKTEDSLIFISNIKSVLEENYNYLRERSENRIFLAYLETIFSDQNWEYLKSDQIGFIKNQLKRFKEGEVNYTELREFSKQLYTQKLGIDKSSKYESKEAKEEK